MELINLKDKDKLNFKEKVIGIIGQFDGLHLGHQKLIEEAKAKAKQLHYKTALITFEPHPDYILGKRVDNGYITPLDKKISLIEENGIDYMIIINFTKYLSKLSPIDFYNQFLKSFIWIFAGSDYRYGAMGSGNIESLREVHKNVVAVALLKYQNTKISSNEIRKLITEGRVDEVYLLMKRYYNISGKVSHGNKVGRTLGIRTANIELSDEYQSIKQGVYAVAVNFNKKRYLGVCNIGHNPTLNFISKQRLEVHIIDFDENLYDEYISVDFLKFLRQETSFASREELINQINDDIKKTKDLFGDKL